MSIEKEVPIQNMLKQSKMYLHSIETSENIDLPKQDFSQKNETAGDWRMERTEDLLFRAVQEYQASLRNQEKGTEN
uniref:Uncharacterized protein n=1 Tax=Wuchereria bancrofti TaxID=6293 RepID=A0A1I8EI66_WUCBA